MWSHHFIANRWGKNGNSERLYFLELQNSLQMVIAAMKLRHLPFGRKAMTNLDSILKSRDITLQTKVCLVKAMVFPVVMYRCESWTIKKAEWWRIDAFEPCCWRRLLRVPWTARRSTVHPKGNQSWIFIGRTDVEAQTPVLWPLDAKNGLIEKDPDARKDWRQEKKGTTEDDMIGWHHRLNAHEFEQAPGVGDGQGSLACCSPWFTKIWTQLSDWTELLFSQLCIVCLSCVINWGTSEQSVSTVGWISHLPSPGPCKIQQAHSPPQPLCHAPSPLTSHSIHLYHSLSPNKQSQM